MESAYPPRRRRRRRRSSIFPLFMALAILAGFAVLWVRAADSGHRPAAQTGTSVAPPVAGAEPGDAIPPVIQGVRDFTVYAGETVSCRSGVTVTDDCDLNPVLEVDTSELNLDVPGCYEIIYTATDSAGNVSLPATVTVTIDKTRSGVTYADTADSAAAAAAQDLAERGVFTGAKIGDTYYFEPEKTVSRSEFLAMILETAGRDVTAVTMTGFCDDGAIPTWAKAYAAAGVTDGIIRGTATAEGVAFRGEEPITFNEAATVLNRVLDLGDVDLSVWYADREAVPSWAAQAVANMEAVSVLAAGSFGSEAMSDQVTRADAAQMLSAAGRLLDGEKPGIFDWLG